MNEKVKIVLSVAFWLFVVWILTGGLSQNNDSNSTNKVYIDCTKPGYENSSYCNGDYESRMRDEAGMENAYYQNMRR